MSLLIFFRRNFFLMKLTIWRILNQLLLESNLSKSFLFIVIFCCLCFLVIVDRSVVYEIMLPASVFEMHRHWLKEDIPVVVEARVTSNRDGGTRVIADAIYDIEKAREQFARRLVVSLNGSSAATEASALLSTLKAYRPGPTPVYIKVLKKDYRGDVALGEEWRVRPHSDLLAKLKAQLEF